MQRRQFLKSSLASLALLKITPLHAALTVAQQKPLVWIFLRGAMDSLDTIIPTADKQLPKLRQGHWSVKELAEHPLNTQFSLHPSLKFTYQLFQRKQMSPIVAVASNYRDRSHFEAQDIMESGLNQVDYDQGWLARALTTYSGKSLAISRTTPLALKGSMTMPHTWYPSQLMHADDDTLARLQDMYANDDLLQRTLAAAIEQQDAPSMDKQRNARPNFTYLARRCGEIIAGDNQISCAMLEMGGWDTHNNQKPRLTRQLDMLDEGIKELHDALGSLWKESMVLITTEFGRTVALNGTAGTDHGTASCMFALGGNLRSTGGSVLGEWPGLSNLYQNRDLMPTSDVRYWLGTTIKQHWDLTDAHISAIFPDLVVV